MEEVTQIRGVVLRKGEEVPITEPILLKDYSKINDRLVRMQTLVRLSLANLLSESVSDLPTFHGKGPLQGDQLVIWMGKYPVQLVTLASERRGRPNGILPENSLAPFADLVLQELSPITRRKCEHLITELVHMHGITCTHSAKCSDVLNLNTCTRRPTWRIAVWELVNE